MRLQDNLEFGQRAQAAGAPVQVEVFSSMWHDFVQESDGCGSSIPLEEARYGANPRQRAVSVMTINC